MFKLMTALHLIFAVFVIGPMAILPMTALRSLRAGSASSVESLSRSTFIYSLVSLGTVVFGFGALGSAPKEWNLSFSDTWVWLSLVLYAAATLLTLFMVVPDMRTAGEALAAGDGDPQARTGPGSAEYRRIAIGNGVASLLLVVVVVLMVTRP